MVEFSDTEILSLCSLDKIAKKVGFHELSVGYYYMVPGKEMEDGLVYMLSENDVNELAKHGQATRLVDIFFMYKKTYFPWPRTSNDGVPKFCEVPKASERGTQVEEAGIVGQDGVKNYRLKSMVRKKKSPRKNRNGANIDNDVQLEDVDEPINENVMNSEVGLFTADSKTTKETNATAQPKLELDFNGTNQQPEPKSNVDARSKSGPDLNGGNLQKGLETNTATQSEPEGDINGANQQQEFGVNDNATAGSSIHKRVQANKERRADWHDIASKFTPTSELDGLGRGLEDSEIEGELTDSDELNSNSSGHEENETKPPKFPRFKASTDMHDPQFKLQMVFATSEEFKKACKSHGVKHGKKIRFSKNDTRRVTTICKSCDWKISTAKMRDNMSFQIKSMKEPHRCGRSFYHGLANSTFLCEKYKNDIRLIPNMKVSELQDKVHIDLNVNITRNQAYKTKKKAKQLIDGEYTKQNSRLWDYCAEVIRENPGSNVFMTTTEDENGDDKFERLLYALRHAKRAFLLVVGLLLDLMDVT
ncbi:hypothetical protein ACH5RR_029029 [Cinchona calisaya]|uniref:Transposase MuDR plant domain-containing protein n=1 Tax=Cinchona calisaya TaxID=153742 RepID=A0ABD2YVR8_9GENT